MTPSTTIDPRDHRGRALGGVGGGVETTRSYLAEEFASGSERTVMRWLRSLLGRDDIVAIWLRPIGSRDTIWYHAGPLHELPDLSALFADESAAGAGTAPGDKSASPRFAA